MFQPPFWIALALSGGITLARFLNPQLSTFYSLYLISLFFTLVSFFAFKKNKSFWFFYLLGVLFLGGALLKQTLETEKDIPVEGPVFVVGSVSSFPICVQSSFGERIHIKLNCEYAFYSLEGWKPMEQIWSVSVPSKGQDIRYGDRVALEGEVSRWQSVHNPGSFDLVFHFQKEGIQANLVVKKRWDLFVLERDTGNFILSWVGKLHRSWSQLIDEYIPSQEKGIVQAFLLGQSRNILPETRDLFAKSGTAHLLAISGGQVAFIAWLLLLFFKFFRVPKKSSYFLTIFLLIFYCILTGRDAPILRATLMVCLYLFGTLLKRESNLIYSLSWSAFFILIARPLEIFDPGFQLSFISVFALGLWGFHSSHFEKEKSSWFQTVKFSFFISLCAWLSTLPLIAHYFFIFSPISVFSNLVAVPFFSGVVACGYAFLLFGSVSRPLAHIFGASLWFLTRIFTQLSELFSRIPFAYFHVRPPTFFEWIGFYGLFFLYFYRGRFLSLRRTFILYLAVFNLFIWKEVFVRPSSLLRITFLDVGHGDSALIEFPNQGNLLVDGGLGGDWDQGRQTVAPFLWSKGITRLDGILITHPHFDHYGGIKYILREFSVGEVFDNGNRDFPLYEELFSGAHVKREGVKLGDCIEGVPNLKIQVLHPYDFFLKKYDFDPNDQSVVFKLQYGNFSLLMSGDAEQKALSSLNGIGLGLKSQVLKVPHHGSFIGKEGEEFFSLVKPEVAILSEALKNRYRLPSPITVESLKNRKIKIFQTGIDGAVECVSNGKNYHIQNFVSPTFQANESTILDETY